MLKFEDPQIPTLTQTELHAVIDVAASFMDFSKQESDGKSPDGFKICTNSFFLYKKRIFEEYSVNAKLRSFIPRSMSLALFTHTTQIMQFLTSQRKHNTNNAVSRRYFSNLNTTASAARVCVSTKAGTLRITVPSASRLLPRTCNAAR